MKATYEQRTIAVIQPGAPLDNNTATATVIDTVVNGVVYNQVDVIVMLGAADITLTALKLQESDTNGADYTDVPGAVFGAAGAPALPSANDDNKLYAFHVDKKGRKRFFKLVVTAGDGATGDYIAALAILSIASESPDTAAARGFAAELFI